MSRPARRWTPAEVDRFKALHADGASLHSIARELDRSKGVVSRKASELGLSFARDRTAAAAQSRVVDGKARRAAAVLAELEILEAEQARVLRVHRGEPGAAWQTVLRGEGGAESVRELDFVPARDAREATNARAGSATIIDRLTDDSGGAEQVRGLLGGLADALGLRTTDSDSDGTADA